MKKNMNKTMMAMLLVLAMAFGAMALAETIPDEPPTLEEVPAIETPAEEPAQEPATDENAALREAMDALRNARQSDRLAALEEELQKYVAEGKLTQEQADAILNQYKARAEQRANGQCDGDCMNGRKGRGGMGNGRMNGGMGRGNMGNGRMNGGMGRGNMGNGRMNGGMNRGGKAGRMNNTPAQTAPEAPQSPAVDDGI